MLQYSDSHIFMRKFTGIGMNGHYIMINTMNKDTILKLLNSTSNEDCLLAVSMIAELSDSRAFFKEYGRILGGQCNITEYINLGERYKLDTKSSFEESIYYKVVDNYYILVRPGSRYIAECYDAYDKQVKIINH